MSTQVTVAFASKDKQTNSPVNYSAQITFKDDEEILKCAAKFVVWGLQKIAREGGFPRRRTVNVDEQGKFVKTVDDKVKDVLLMPDEEKRARWEESRAIIAALDKEMSVAGGKKVNSSQV